MIKKIPLIQPDIGKEEFDNVNKCLKKGWISSSSKGHFVRQFEKLFDKTIGNKYSVAVSNGTIALQLALQSLNVKQNDEVIVPNLTFAATANAVLNVGANLVLCDVEKKTWNVSTDAICKKINSKTKAIIVVHLYGQPFDTKKLKKRLGKRKIYIIEDCAEAIGSMYYGHHVGRYADAATFSFFGNKTITTGEGGMVAFNKIKYKNLALKIRNNGMSFNKKYWHELLGSNYKLTNLQAAIGVAQMKKIKKYLNKKIIIANNYDRLFEEAKVKVNTPIKNKNFTNSYWLYTILLDNYKKRNELIKFLHKKGVETRPFFYPLNKMKPYKTKDKTIFKNSHIISRSGISLPSSFNLSLENQKFIVEKINEFLR